MSNHKFIGSRFIIVAIGGLLATFANIPGLRAEDQPVAIATALSGHIHPSIGRTKDGTLIVVYKGANVLMQTRSADGGKTWSKPETIATSAKRPDVIREVKVFEVYPGTVDVLPDDRVLVTWNYIADDKAKDGYYERALLYSISSDQGRTWSDQELIGPVDGKHLGAVRHNVLPWSDGRWLLPLRAGPPRLFDPKSRELTLFPLTDSDKQQHSFQQIVRTPQGTLLAMGPVLLRSTDAGRSWATVETFRSVPDIDTAEGRYLTVLSDGRVLVTWGVGTANKGLRYNVSADDGLTWNNDNTTLLLPETNVAARYYSARTVQLDDQHIGTVFVNGGVFFLKVRLDRVAEVAVALPTKTQSKAATPANRFANSGTVALVGEQTARSIPSNTGYEKTAKPFIQQHCIGCHGAETAKAGYRIDLIGTDFSAATVADHWKEVLDRINAGEMPPKDRPRPEARQSADFVTWVNEQLRQVDLAAKKAGGRIPMRRLNRDEYANTVRDLLKLEEQIVRPLIEELPGDGQAEGFDRLGVALFFDQTQIERSLSVAEKIVSRAIVTAPPKQNSFTNRFDILRKKPPPEMVEVFPGFAHTIPRGAKDRIVHPDHIEHIQGGPTYRRDYDGWGSIDHFAVSQVVTQDGYYRLRIKATVDNRGRTEPNKFRLQYAVDSPIFVEQEVPLDPSGTTEALLFLRGPVNGEVKGPQVFRLLWNHTEKAVINEPNYKILFSKWTALRGKTEQAVTRRAPQADLDDLKKQRDELEKQLNAWEGPAYIDNPEMDLEKLPRLLIESIEITGPIQKEWPPASHKSLLFAGDERRDDEYVREIFARFLPRAYRRPVTDREIDSIVAVVKDAQSMSKLSFHEAMRTGLQRVLSAPGFWFLEEPTGEQVQPRPLTDYELASRLSYFLWSTMPDDELFALAAAGKLRDPETAAKQVRRMIADPKSLQLVQNFAGQWLSVRGYGSVQPAAEYRDYDKSLENASKQEPLSFFAEVLNQNLPITTFIDSDFVVVNERLARHYGIEGVTGAEFRRVAIKPANHRGGVLGMAGLMTFLADGTRTLPMRRGSWVLRELFNDPPNNPPPNAGEIQPNTSGKNLTVRERLELHRRDEVCASCHAKLDPIGLALENYDAIGAWRERFNGEGFRGSNGPLLDVSGTLPDGRKFATLDEYKVGLLAHKDKFARALSAKLLTYALGRPVGYTDHKLIDSLVDTLKRDDYRIQPLIHAIVACEPFRHK